jgi:hypothetical protein
LPQGSRTQDQYQGTVSKQEQKQKPALTRLAVNETKKKNNNLPLPDDRMLKIAGEVIREAPRGIHTEYLVDAFQEQCRREGIPTTKAIAIAALAQSHAGVTA